jgi:FkbM family methyltransferase
MNDSSQSLRRAIADSRSSFQAVLDRASAGVYLYGAGFVGRWSVAYLADLGLPVKGFLDSDERKRGTVVCGTPVLSMEDLRRDPSAPILITSRHAVPAISRLLAGVPNPVVSIDAFVVHHESPACLARVESLFALETSSLRTFHAILLSMLAGHTRSLAPYASAQPFFDRFGFFNRDGEVFVDAGAYVGDSVERFIWSVNGAFRQIHAFEPGRPQFHALTQRVSRLRQEWALADDCIRLNNQALSAFDGRVQVAQGDLPIRTSVGIAPAPAASDVPVGDIEAVTLDACFSDQPYTLLKVDVEGSEEALLQGGATTLARYRPRIALSAYHFPTDIFRLPLQVQAINADYEFALGHHSSQLMDTVIYCRDRHD